jgi:dTDP-4-dehydrorhamnose reductase
VARALNDRAISTVFVSTDAVFDGTRGSWRDDDTPNPLHAYGRQKRAAELEILQLTDSLVVRLPKLIVGDLHPDCFVSAWSRALWDGQPISCATDQRFNPLGAADAAAAILALIDIRAEGLVHVASADAVRRWDLLQRLIEQMGDALTKPSRILPCTLADLGLPEPRPVDSSLVPSAIVSALPLELRTPLELIDDVAPKLIRGVREGH